MGRLSLDRGREKECIPRREGAAIMRKIRKHHHLSLTAAAAALCLLSLQTYAANEKAFVKVWRQHIKHPDQHSEAIAACREFSAGNKGDELVRVVQGIEVWHLLKAKRNQEAVKILESHLTPNTTRTGSGAAILARGWMSLIDIAPVKQALQCYYRKEVGYPESLDALVGHPGIPAELKFRLNDRWDSPWNYRLTGFKSTPGFRNQRYSISSSRLNSTPDLDSALQIPYASGIHIRPIRTRTTGSSTLVEFTKDLGKQKEGQSFLLSAGRRSGDILLAYVGEKLIVVCDRLHWKVLPKPRGSN